MSKLKFVVMGAILVAFVIFGAILGALVGLISSAILSVTPLGPIVENGLVAILGETARGQLINFGTALGFIAGFFERVLKMDFKQSTTVVKSG